MAKHKLRVGFVGLSARTYFAEENRQRERAISGLQRLAQTLDFDLFAVIHEVATQEQVVQAEQYLREQTLDFLLIQTSSVSSGDFFLSLVHAAPRLGLWATPDPQLEGEIQLHSLVAMSHYASILKRYLRDENIPYKWFYDHVETETFQRRFAVTIRALTGVKHIERARVGWIGGLSPGFHNMAFDERLMRHRLGVQVGTHEMSELVNRAASYHESPVQVLANEIRGAASKVTVSSAEAFNRVTRLYMALKDMAKEYEYDVLAVQCWSKAQELYNVVPCMAYSWMGSEDGIAVSCEGDVPGAISMYLLNVLTGSTQSSTLLDIAALDPKTNLMLMWHCGVSPRHFADQNGIQWVDHVTLGRKTESSPYGVAGDQVFAPQKETTITYVGDDGSRLLVVRSSILEHPEGAKGFDGTRGWFAQFELNKQPVTLWDLINTLTVRGHEHHFAVGIGDVTSELMEFAAWKQMRLIEHVPYTDYLQIEGVNA